jgi:hypothetical protein
VLQGRSLRVFGSESGKLIKSDKLVPNLLTPHCVIWFVQHPFPFVARTSQPLILPRISKMEKMKLKFSNLAIIQVLIITQYVTLYKRP